MTETSDRANQDEDAMEDGDGVGKRIFVNRDDDNQNGQADVYDFLSDYTLPDPDRADNDFAEIKFDVGVDLSDFENHYLYLIASKGLNIWADTKKTEIALDPNDHALLFDTKDVNDYPKPGDLKTTDPTHDVYFWKIGPDTTFSEKTFYVEGTDVGRQVVWWQLRTPSNAILLQDVIEINVEKIVWPFEPDCQVKVGQFGGLEPNLGWYEENTENWEGFALKGPWRMESALVDIILSEGSGIAATIYPNEENGTACSSGAPMSAINGDYGGFENGFTLELDYDFDTSRGDGTTGWVKIIANNVDRFKISNVGNSGVKFGAPPTTNANGEEQMGGRGRGGYPRHGVDGHEGRGHRNADGLRRGVGEWRRSELP